MEIRCKRNKRKNCQDKKKEEKKAREKDGIEENAERRGELKRRK